MTSYTQPSVRHDFVLLFDVTDGNPNGDPDAGNLPRVDPETMEGLVSDVSLKRKVRNFVEIVKGDEARYKIYVQAGEALNTKHQWAYDAEGIKSTGTKQAKSDIDKVRAWMCQNFYDIRTFGAVMTTGVNCGQVRGPIQMTFGRSFDPIVPLDVTITRVAVTKPEDAKVVVVDSGDESRTEGKQSEMGRKSIVPYGLYRAQGFYNPYFAEQTGFSEEDLALFWQALQSMWDFDRSSSRGLMTCQGLYVFSHESKLGNAQAHRLFEKISVGLKPGIDVPRQFSDYSVSVGSEISTGVTLHQLVY